MTVWSLQSYCETQFQHAQEQQALLEGYSSTSLDFLNRLGLPSVHPFCTQDEFRHPDTGLVDDNAFVLDGVPPMGSLDPQDFEEIIHVKQSLASKLYTLWCRTAPVLLAMTELWLRLLAGVIAPIGIVYLLHTLIIDSAAYTLNNKISKKRQQQQQQERGRHIFMSFVMILTTASALVVMTDTLYVLDYGYTYGVSMFVTAIGLSFWMCYQHNLSITSVLLTGLVLLAIFLIWDVSEDDFTFGQKNDVVSPSLTDGLYYNAANPFVSSLVANWPEKYRTYNFSTGATPWMPTGDSRTGLPFLLNHVTNPNWHRVFLQVDYNFPAEYVALDITFPPMNSDGGDGGYDPAKPVYMILHGLNGGSNEEYVRDFTKRRTAEGSTVIVMVARGLMDLPVRGWSNFHGARTTDAHEAAWAIRRAVDAIDPSTTVVGVGFSMGAIVLSNYVASYGGDCPLDGAIAFSGGLDMRNQEDFPRAQRLWQPMLAETLREDFLLGKWGRRVLTAIPREHFYKMIRATHVTEIDRYAVVSYNNYDDLDHYYRSMSALGDIPHLVDGTLPIQNSGKIHSLSIPLAVVQSLDDPLVTWRATVNNDGFMHPTNLIESGDGNLMILLTKKGGHVGWPTGLFPFIDKWKWMSNAAGSFGVAVDAAKKYKLRQD